MSAEEATHLGPISRLMERDKFFDTAMELALTMNGKNPIAFRLTKEGINMNLDAGGLEQALNMEDRNQILLVARRFLDQGGEEGLLFLVFCPRNKMNHRSVVQPSQIGLFKLEIRISKQ